MDAGDPPSLQAARPWKKQAFGFLLLTVAYLGIYWLAARGAQVHVGGDTTAYEAAGRYEPFWAQVFSIGRPPIYPMLFRLADFSRPAVVTFQSAASLGAWIFVAATLGRRNLLLAASVFYVALYPGFAAWNTVLMTESLDVSMTVIAFAFLLRFFDGARSALWLFVGLMALKCFLRSFDSFLNVFFIPVLIALAWLGRASWKGCAVSTVLFLACFFFVNRTLGGHADDVWYSALLNNIGLRVLPDPKWLRYFVAHGMPLNDALRSMTGRHFFDENWKFFTDPDLAEFRDWARAHGRGVLARYLVEHPKLMLDLLWQHRGEVFQGGAFQLHWYFDPGYRLGVPPWPQYWTVYAAGAAGSVVLTVACLARSLPGHLVAPALTAIAMWLMLLPIALCAFYGDPEETYRHSLPVLLQAALSLLLMMYVLARARFSSRGLRQR